MLQVALSVTGILAGPVMAIFLLAFFNPWSETIGIFVGFILGNAAAVWCYIGSRVSRAIIALNHVYLNLFGFFIAALLAGPFLYFDHFHIFDLFCTSTHRVYSRPKLYFHLNLTWTFLSQLNFDLFSQTNAYP